MNTLYLLSGAVAGMLAIYLLIALFKPEKF